MYLVISEKPSVSQAIGKVIGAYRRENGYLEGRDCVVSWCLGHLAEYVSPEIYDERYGKWQFDDLPIVPDSWQLAVAKDKKEQYQVLKKLLNRTDFEYIVNACDAGREGELIFKRVYDLSGSTLPVKRLWISSMEDQAIKDGFTHLRDGRDYKNLADASVCRAKADWLIGMNATRALTTTYGKKLIVGRVQSPTLSMLVERNEQINHFQKQKCFNVSLDMDGLIVEKQKIQFEDEAEKICEKCRGQSATVDKVISTEKKINPPRLYDLTTLQRDANRHYGLTAQQTLNCAQSLYEKKLTTYPRTDSQYLTDDMQATAEKVAEVVKKKYGFDNPFEDTPIPVNVSLVLNRKKVSDHHAIIPTLELEKQETAGLSRDEGRVLYLIALRLLEAVGNPHKYLETEVTAECMGELFTAKGKTVIEMGWKALEEQLQRSAEATTDIQADLTLKPVKEGEICSNVDVKKTEHYTSPPKAFNEDTLLAAMESAGKKEFDQDAERKGLGTPATRASIIEKLVHSGYVKRKGKLIAPTEDGVILSSVLPEYLRSVTMTAEWENRLLEMEKGEVPPEQFMEGINRLVGKVLDECRGLSDEQRYRFREKKEAIGICPVCGAPVYESKNNFYCSSKECSFALWKENRYLKSMKKKIDIQSASQLLENGRCRMKKLYSEKKNKYFNADLLMKVKDGRAEFSLEFTNNKEGAAENGKNK